MSKPTQRRAGRIAFAAGRLVGSTPRPERCRALAIVALMIWLAISVMAVDARVQAHSQDEALDVQITEVRALQTPEARTTTEVEIRWTAQVPRLTTIDDFEVQLQVRYTDGTKRAARSEQLKSSVRAAILQLATHPRQKSSAVLKDFNVAVKVRFRIPASSPVAQRALFRRSGTIEGKRAQLRARDRRFRINVKDRDAAAWLRCSASLSVATGK